MAHQPKARMKKAPRISQSPSQTDFSDSMDQVIHCCANIEALAVLLECADGAVGLTPKTLTSAACLIQDETRNLREMLRGLHRQLLKQKRID